MKINAKSPLKRTLESFFTENYLNFRGLLFLKSSCDKMLLRSVLHFCASSLPSCHAQDFISPVFCISTVSLAPVIGS